ncbi:hypothetical protein HRTV-10_gp93 [Halorubrum tailed virus 10]|uniref:Uncharacterized protein n=1 Tax=Halorubrum tailed virus 10 TaxID=2877991 RepID=A0AAE8XSX0_9CAUD|nr:hypothetical protein M1M36_gp039 [Halorubrum tailed virus 10]UBF19422.1 hypothetical protein HRTV-19_gp96 [Halorubrum virus HRTV-19]UBF19551.1 hypothetical protein HRTV-23_gp96 [Halorubrum virus HRTV-23]UBF19799.1 hypothetical protein HRTV-18_gp90 [Halorubrum virus HRTV-18]UBF19922.1 hypothetical protein HRTV-20_gp90 [Halorubrum virus HRTV-20]UBF20048.1 hypothetical protein HRTV-22_gp93 [Halorubrum virus HRTV-22]UBF20174.1 hypothetical protein HRTV-26_gp93 [Halorubrum virus HRTV-26]
MKDRGINPVLLASVCQPDWLLPTHPFPTYWMDSEESMNPMETAS